MAILQYIVRKIRVGKLPSLKMNSSDQTTRRQSDKRPSG